VNAGSGAVRVVVGPGVPPFVVVCAGVVVVEVVLVVGRVVVPVLSDGAGALDTDTVLVPPPHPPSSNPTTSVVGSRPCLIASMVFVARLRPPT